MKPKAGALLLFFGVFWSGMVLIFDGIFLAPAWRQLKARDYVPVEATIRSSEVTVHSDGEGTTYGLKMAYEYSVGDTEYIGNKYRYGRFSSSDRWAYRVVDSHPPGRKVTAYYNPHNPGDAVLSVGIGGSDLFMALFLTPFNVVMLGLWCAGATLTWRKWFKPAFGAVKIATSLRRTRVRLVEFPTLAVPAGVLAVSSFLSVFVVAPFYGGFHPSLRVMMVTWSVVLALTFCFTIWHVILRFSGKYDLVLDELGGWVDLPATNGRKTRRRVGLKAITAARIETLREPKRSDDSPPRYALILELSENPQKETLVKWGSLEKTTALANWLRTKLPTRPSRSLAGTVIA